MKVSGLKTLGTMKEISPDSLVQCVVFYKYLKTKKSMFRSQTLTWHSKGNE